MSNEQWASFQRRKMTCFERVGGEKCKMFQLNVRGEGSRQLCVGTSAPRLQDECSLHQPRLSVGPQAEEEASLSMRGSRQRYLFLRSPASLPQPRCVCGYVYVDVDLSLPRQWIPEIMCGTLWKLQHLVLLHLPTHCHSPQGIEWA